MAAVVHPSRPQIRRTSPRLVFNASHGSAVDALGIRRINVEEDSESDDEPPPAIKFSKATQALLADAGVPTSPHRRINASNAPRVNRSISTGQPGADTPSRVSGLKIIRHSSPSLAGALEQKERGDTPPRIVYLNTSKLSESGKRSISISGPYPHRAAAKRGPTPEINTKPEVVTPAPAPRAIRIRTRSRAGSNASQDEPSHLISSISRPASRAGAGAPDTDDRKPSSHDLYRSTSKQNASDYVSRHGATAANVSRNTSSDVAPPSGTQRMKRVPVGTTGSFFNRRPVRGGFRRRESDDNISPIDDAQGNSASQPSATNSTPHNRSISQVDGGRSRNSSVNARATSVEPVSVNDFAPNPSATYGSRPSSRQGYQYPSKGQTTSESRPGSRQGGGESSYGRQPSVERHQRRKESNAPLPESSVPSAHTTAPRRISTDQAQSKSVVEQKPLQRAPSLGRATYRYVATRTQTDASEDQENLPPPTFKRNKDAEFKYLGKMSMSMLSDDEKPKPRVVEETPVPVPHVEQRRALGAISGNTPHRTAPAPPPKMSVLDTATTTGGASTTKSRKKRQHMVVNGKIFTQMGKIGKGGSSDVYCVMAENYKTFALKRVKLEDCDESAVRGYKGEIDLLKKLTEVERVVRLFDWELNDDKQELVVLMEKGDTDLNRLLTLRLNGVDARFDSCFTRYHWKEMLECVQAVHEHDVVHSDLKPANFLLVQGRLKLIDFGIANAIDTDNTCNVHRDNHVGTPNYMSPESITDTNASSSAKDEAGRPLKKDMRIGKSSDVWSLGCILYQMTYGRPPFAHIPNQLARILAITNAKHVIEFPETGVGNAPVPAALRGTLKRCLNRNPDRRPTVKELLADSDEFLNPEGSGTGSVLISEEMLSAIIHRIYDRCRDPQRGLPTPEEVLVYPRSFMTRLREKS